MKLSGAWRGRPGGKISAQGCLDPETRAIKPIVDDLNWLSPFATSVVTLPNSFFWRLLFCRRKAEPALPQDPTPDLQSPLRTSASSPRRPENWDQRCKKQPSSHIRTLTRADSVSAHEDGGENGTAHDCRSQDLQEVAARFGHCVASPGRQRIALTPVGSDFEFCIQFSKGIVVSVTRGR
jgi:hypothetical protein